MNYKKILAIALFGSLIGLSTPQQYQSNLQSQQGASNGQPGVVSASDSDIHGQQGQQGPDVAKHSEHSWKDKNGTVHQSKEHTDVNGTTQSHSWQGKDGKTHETHQVTDDKGNVHQGYQWTDKKGDVHEAWQWTDKDGKVKYGHNVRDSNGTIIKLDHKHGDADGNQTGNADRKHHGNHNETNGAVPLGPQAPTYQQGS